MSNASVLAAPATFDLAIGIPAYSRSRELVELLSSIAAQTLLPAEVTICEDHSPEREQIRAIVQEWTPRLQALGCHVNYHENEENLGYDGNIRKLFAVSHASWVMLIGNDDLLLPDGVEKVAAYLATAGEEKVLSRSFARFESDIQHPLGVSRLSDVDCVFNPANSRPRMVFRSCGFVGGLVIHRAWADSLATDAYDGTLYYQIYLAAEAFCQGGIGYIAAATVGGRAGNPPLFGAAAHEKGVHVPGSYTPRGRAKMWRSVLRIADEVGARHGQNLLSDIKEELAVRQSFHVFEMMAGAGRPALVELRQELRGLGLYEQAVPRFLFALDYVLGARAAVFYRFVRALLQ